MGEYADRVRAEYYAEKKLKEARLRWRMHAYAYRVWLKARMVENHKGL